MPITVYRLKRKGRKVKRPQVKESIKRFDLRGPKTKKLKKGKD